VTRRKKPDPEQIEAEARAARPDLAWRIEEEKSAHEQALRRALEEQALKHEQVAEIHRRAHAQEMDNCFAARAELERELGGARAGARGTPAPITRAGDARRPRLPLLERRGEARPPEEEVSR
jgi:hypothetical protein